MSRFYKLAWFVPPSHLEVTKQALFDAGAGRLGHYEHCAFQTLGQGQFRPLVGSDPFLGRHGELERVEEYRVEVLCPAECLPQAMAALRQAHPYEEPAIDVWELVSGRESGML